MSIFAPSYIFLCLFTVSNYFSARVYLGIDLHIPLLLGSACLIFHIIESVSAGRRIVKLNFPLALLCIAFLFFLNATFVLSYDLARSIYVFDTFSKVVVLYILIANVIKTRQQFHGYLLVLTICAFFLAFRVLNYGKWEYGRVFIQGSQLVTTDPNFLALVLAYSIPLIVAAWFALEKKRNPIVIVIFCFILLRVVQGFILTESRGGFLGIVAGAVVFFFMIKTVKRKVIAFLIFLPVFGLLFARYVPMDYYYRMQEILYPEADPTGSALIRAQSMGIALKYMLTHPLSEYGVGNHSYLLLTELNGYDWYPDGDIFRGRLIAHSFILQIGADTGFIPLLFYLGFIVCLVWRLYAVVKTAPQNKEEEIEQFFSKSVLISIAILCAGGFFLPMGYTPFVFYLGGLADAVYTLHQQRVEVIETEEVVREEIA